MVCSECGEPLVHSPLNVLAGDQMRSPDRRETAEQDLFRSALITGGSRGLGLEIADIYQIEYVK